MTATPASQKRAHDAWRLRLLADGGTYTTLPLAADEVRNLDRLRHGDETRPACLRRLIREAVARV
jgi:hypothetical protein